MKSSTDTPAEALGIIIRRARHDDAPEVAELMAALGYPSPVADMERRIAASTASPDTAVFVEESANRVAGVISFHCIPLFHADGSLGRITSLVVAPSSRRSGVGRSRGCIRFEVTSGDHRPDAQASYEHLGYQFDCRRVVKPNCKP